MRDCMWSVGYAGQSPATNVVPIHSGILLRRCAGNVHLQCFSESADQCALFAVANALESLHEFVARAKTVEPIWPRQANRFTAELHPDARAICV